MDRTTSVKGRLCLRHAIVIEPENGDETAAIHGTVETASEIVVAKVEMAAATGTSSAMDREVDLQAATARASMTATTTAFSVDASTTAIMTKGVAPTLSTGTVTLGECRHLGQTHLCPTRVALASKTEMEGTGGRRHLAEVATTRRTSTGAAATADYHHMGVIHCHRLETGRQVPTQQHCRTVDVLWLRPTPRRRRRRREEMQMTLKGVHAGLTDHLHDCEMLVERLRRHDPRTESSLS